MSLARPRFKHCFHVEVLEPEYVMLLTEDRVYALEGRAFKHLAPLLDGRRTPEELVEALEASVPAPEIFYALDRLEKRGYLVEGGEDVPPAAAAFWERLEVPGAVAAARLGAAKVSLTSLGPATRGLEDALERLGVRTDPDGVLEVVLTPDYMDRRLEAVNRASLASGRPVLLAKPAGYVIWIGPLLIPGRTACWECLASRLRGNRQVERYLSRRTGRDDLPPTTRAGLPSTVGLAESLAATEIARWLVLGRSPRLEGRIATLDLASLETADHVVVKRPQCPACGEPRPPATTHPRLSPESRPKRPSPEGGRRVESPQQTWDRLRHHVSPITGIVSSLVRKDGSENGVTYSYAAGHDFPMLSSDLNVLRANLRFRSGGKGTTEIQARVSALCEAIERHSGVYRGDEPVVRGSYRSLGEDAIHLRDVLLFSEEQYRTRHEWNRRCSFTHYHVVPEPFDEGAVIDWAPLWSLTHERVRYLPSAYCYYAHPEGEHFFCATDANGTSAGNSLTEAALQGFMELVERDAVALWWYNRLPRPLVDVASFGMPYANRVFEHHGGLGRQCWVLDLTSDLGIPTFASVSRRTHHSSEDVIVGFGSHFDARAALIRSLTEANQFLAALSRTGPDGRTAYAYDDPDALAWWQNATVASDPYLLPDPAAPVRVAADFPRDSSEDIADDLGAAVRVAADHGLEVLVLDQTRPDVGQSVARVVVPGLRHFWRRLGPGRLYEVPVRMGWLAAPIPEADLNPFSLFF